MSDDPVVADADETEAPDPASPMIVCQGVEKWFGKFQALKGIDLAVAESEVVVVIGPSGSGKSTFIRCINHLEPHDRGRIVVDGTEVTNDLRHIAEVRREVGMVFQSFNLFPHLTVLDNVTLGPRKVRRWPKAEAEVGGPRDARAGAHPRAGRRSTRASCRAASSSGWPSPGRWPCGPR